MAAVLIALITVTSVGAFFFADEPLRRYTEAKMNAHLKGYTVSIRACMSARSTSR